MLSQNNSDVLDSVIMNSEYFSWKKKSLNIKFLLLILKVDNRKPKLAASLDFGCYRDENTIVLNSFGSYVYLRFCVVLEIKPRTLLSYTETYLYVFLTVCFVVLGFDLGLCTC